jgi:hypothetical protein
VPKKISSQSLEPMLRALQMSGQQSQETELHDGTVDQIVSVNEIARRGGTPAGSSGIFRGLLENVHAGSDSKTSGYTLYAPTGNPSLIIPPLPDPMPNNLEWWILAASVQRTAGTGFLGTAALTLNNLLQGWGVNDSGAQVAANRPLILANWSGQIATGSIVYGGNWDGTSGNVPGPAHARIGIRVPVGGAFGSSPTVQFFSTEVGAVATTFTCTILMGLFPPGLGQDGLC